MVTAVGLGAVFPCPQDCPGPTLPAVQGSCPPMRPPWGVVGSPRSRAARSPAVTCPSFLTKHRVQETVSQPRPTEPGVCAPSLFRTEMSAGIPATTQGIWDTWGPLTGLQRRALCMGATPASPQLGRRGPARAPATSTFPGPREALRFPRTRPACRHLPGLVPVNAGVPPAGRELCLWAAEGPLHLAGLKLARDAPDTHSAQKPRGSAPAWGAARHRADRPPRTAAAWASPGPVTAC